MKNKRDVIISDIVAQTISSLIAAIIISSIALFSADKFYSTPRLMGFWSFEINIQNSSFSNYNDLKIVYHVVLTQYGNRIEGVGEKFSEQLFTSKKATELRGKSRVPIKVNGTIDKKFFFSDEVLVTILEEGSSRDSSSFHHLSVESDNLLGGEFKSTIARSMGKVIWRRM